VGGEAQIEGGGEDRGSGGRGEKRKGFLETLVPSCVLENPRHRAFLAALERALWKRRIKREQFGWASAFFGQKAQKNQNQIGPQADGRRQSTDVSILSRFVIRCFFLFENKDRRGITYNLRLYRLIQQECQTRAMNVHRAEHTT
jgi:hypothetical protein